MVEVSCEAVPQSRFTGQSNNLEEPAMSRILTALAVLLIPLPATAEVESVDPPEATGQIERLDPQLDELIDQNAPIEVLGRGFEWSEGPVWIDQGGYILFSDIPRNAIFRYAEGKGVERFIYPSGYTGSKSRTGESGSNGLALDHQGRLLLCQHGDHRVARLVSPLGVSPPEYETLVDSYQGKALNSPNDLVVHSSGAIYFTDPPYGRVGAFDAPNRPLDFQGVYRLDPDGTLTLLTDQLRAPNGIALSPDESILYVAQSDSKRPIYMAYDIQPDLGINEGRLLFDGSPLAAEHPGSPDGMVIDKSGNLFATGPGGVLVLTPEGKHLGTIHTGGLIANCTFGDDGQTLYMTSDDRFCRVRTRTAGW